MVDEEFFSRHSLLRKVLLVCPILVLYSLYVAYFVKWPEVFIFQQSSNGGDVSRILNSDVHLDDDVMITLRSGSILSETGLPAFNRGDLAQPSTSLLGPYLYAILDSILATNIAVGMYALLSFLGASIAVALVFFRSKSPIFGSIVVLLLLASKTFTLFSLTGWDHNLQSFFFCVAAGLAFFGKPTKGRALGFGFLLFLGCAMRPDGGLIAIGLLLTFYLRHRQTWLLFASLFSFSLPTGLLLFQNWYWFGFFTPTTSRLKLGRDLSFESSFGYISRELANFTVLHLFTLLILLSFAFYKAIPRFVFPVIVSCLVTGMYGIFVTDVFPGMRMLWTPTVLLAFAIASSLPIVRRSGSISLTMLPDSFNFGPRFLKIVLVIFLPFSLYPLIVDSYFHVGQKSSMVRTVDTSATSAQYSLALWVRQNLNPLNGSVGLYWLGIGFHLPDFEVADFLGKADELIAQGPLRWGQPGHDKWDSQVTIKKWNPQVIIPPEFDIFNYSAREARVWLANREDWAFVADLRLNPLLPQDYLDCTVRSGASLEGQKSWHLLLRRDVYSSSSFVDLSCRSIPRDF